MNKDITKRPKGRNNLSSAKKRPAAKAAATPADRMLAKLKESGLDLKDAAALKLKAFADNSSLGLSRNGAGFRIPYFAYTGEPLDMFRYRYFETVAQSGFAKGAALRKYDQPYGTDPEIYLPPLSTVSWAEVFTDPSQPIILTEGELKSACATKYVMPCIGLGGVWNYGRKARYQEFLPSLQVIKWAGRAVYICYDSDAVTNRLVITAELRLARILTDLGAMVKIVRIPPDGDKKVGIDDYIVKYGADAFKDLMLTTEEYGPFAALHALNEQVIYVRHPSMVVEYPKENHPEGQSRYKIMQSSKFVKEVYANLHYFESVEDKNVERKTAANWIEWGARSEVHSVTYAPGAETTVNGNQFNFWEGWGAEPVKGDVSLFKRYFDHITQGLKPAEKKWLLQWFAFPIQHPGVKMYTAVAFWSREQGTGKSLLGYSMQRIYGENFKEVEKSDLEDQFNSWLANRQFIMGEEITGSDKREFADRLKHLITGHTLTLKEKYVPNYTIPNRVNFYFTSNHEDAFFLDNDDRRYFIHEVIADKSKFDFKAYDRWYKTDEAAAALFYYFLNEVDLEGFDPQAAAPRTDAKDAMVRTNDTAADRLAHDIATNEDATFFAPAASSFGPTLYADTLKELRGRDLWTSDQIIKHYRVKEPNDPDLKYLNKYTLPKALRKRKFPSSTNEVRIELDGKEQKARVWILFHRDKYKNKDGDELGTLFSAQWESGKKYGKNPGKHK